MNTYEKKKKENKKIYVLSYDLALAESRIF